MDYRRKCRAVLVMNITGIFPSRSQKIRYGVDTNNSGGQVCFLTTSKTMGSAIKSTFNVWIKLQASTASKWIIGDGSEFSGDFFAVRVTDTTIVVVNKTGATTRGHSFTVTDMNDSAWHHIFIQLDTSQATDTNRVKLWLDGAAQTPASTGSGYFTLSQSVAPTIGRAFAHTDSGGTLRLFDAYVADMSYVDGAIVDISRFARSTSGGMRPVRYRGPFGTEGFFFEFIDTTNFGKDSAGNGDWTENESLGGVFIQITDTPSG